jgi:hypothetical protein
MGMKRLSDSGIIVVWKAEKLALLSHYFAQGYIVDMTDLREKVMLYLEIQAASQPGNDLVPGSKVGGSPDLMDGPFGIYDLIRFVGHIKRGLFNDMRQLKYHR